MMKLLEHSWRKLSEGLVKSETARPSRQSAAFFAFIYRAGIDGNTYVGEVHT